MTKMKQQEPSGRRRKRRSTYRGEISRMREQDAPGVTEPLMELDRALGSLSLEVRRNRTKTKMNHGSLL